MLSGDACFILRWTLTDIQPPPITRPPLSLGYTTSMSMFYYLLLGVLLLNITVFKFPER